MAGAGLVRQYPWQPHSLLLGNLAIGNLREQLRLGLSTERGVNAPTLMVAIGALAGFAAQNAALADAAGRTVPGNELALVTTSSGARYIVGGLVDRLMFDQRDAEVVVSTLVAAAAVTHGADPMTLPDYPEISGHVAGTIGTDAFGLVRAPDDDTPRQQPIECLTQLWPVFEGLMRLPPPAQVKTPEEPPLDEACWPIIAALAADQFIERARDVLAPHISAALVIEAAIVAAKIDPEHIVPGRWSLEPSSGGVRVSRTHNAMRS